MRCRSRARPGQRLPPCMHSGGTSRHLLVTSPKCARARAQLLASIVTLSGSHVFPGEIVAVSDLGSAPAVGSRHDGGWPLGPHAPLAALRDRDGMRAPWGGRLVDPFSKPLSVLNKARPPELKHSLLARSKGASVLSRDSAPNSGSVWPRQPWFVEFLELARSRLPWDGRFTTHVVK